MSVALVLVLVVAVSGASAAAWLMTRMPGASFREPAPPLTAGQMFTRATLESDVAALAREPRNALHPGSLSRAAAAISARMGECSADEAGNVIAVVRGTGTGIVVIGAHYDSAGDSPGADDNATGVAAVLELFRRFRNALPARTVRFVAFVNEEPPFFGTPEMGSRRYAEACLERGERITAMLCIESIGFFGERQDYPPGLRRLYPPRGDFIAFVSDLRSGQLLRRCVAAFRRVATVPSEGAALPRVIDMISWSDHRSFWEIGVPALMVTDTAPLRNPHYHTAADQPETLDHDRMVRVVDGLESVVRELAGCPAV